MTAVIMATTTTRVAILVPIPVYNSPSKDQNGENHSKPLQKSIIEIIFSSYQNSGWTNIVTNNLQ